MRRLAVLSLMAAALGLLGWLNFHWASAAIDVSSIRPRGGTAGQGDSAAPAHPATATGSPIGDLSQSLLRPIFHASRRPFEPEPPEPEPEMTVFEEPEPVEEPVAIEIYHEEVPTLPPPDIVLVGVNLSAERRSALLGIYGSERLDWVALGESFQGWTVTAVTKDEVTISDGVQAARINLYPAVDRRSVVE